MKKQTNNADQDKKYLQALKESDERFRSIVFRSPDAIIVTDTKGKIEYVNPVAEKVFNCKLENFVGKDFGLTLINGESTEIDIIRPGKDPGVGDMNVVETEWLGDKAHLITIRDITERKQKDEALKVSEAHYRLLAEHMTDIVWMMDLDLSVTWLSPSAMKARGFSVDEITALPLDRQLTPDSLGKAVNWLGERMRLEKDGLLSETGDILSGELEFYCKDGRTIVLDCTFQFIRDEQGKATDILAEGKDITARKQAERALRETRDYLDNLIGYANAPIITWDSASRITLFNHAFERLTGYTAEEVMGQELFILFPETSRDESLNKIMHTSLGEYWESADLPIRRKDGVIRIVLWNSANIYDQDGKTLLATIAQGQDITERKRAKEELQKTLESLRKAVGATIHVMVSAVEMRDPYTAGHQIRVANLAIAIAKEIGLPQEKIDGIRMAGSIHDIGKLSVPAEILSKPTKLTNLEFSIIKEHSRKGYEMLKDVESSWPLAQIVYQHHERMDGSGYPRNLKGDEILMEARIMAVADVVEAMASHRPYRPALGIDAALNEIEKDRGTLYDDAVVDTCLRLFREKGFQFEVA